MTVRRAGAADRPGLWRRDFVLAIGVNAAVMLVFYLLMTTMALYAVEQFRTSEALAGLVASMFIIGAVAGRLGAGPLVALLGSRRALLLGLLIYIVAAIAYLPGFGLAFLLVLRFVHGFAFGLASTAVNTAAQVIIPPARRGEGTSYFAMSWPLASAVGPFLALALIGPWGYEALFLGCLVISVIGLLTALPMTSAPAAPRGTRSLWHGLVAREAVPLGILMLVLGTAMSSIVIFMHPYTASQGMAQAAGAFFLAYALSTAGIRLFIGRVQDRWGDHVIMYPALVSFALGLLVASRADGQGEIIAAGVLVGIGFGTAMPSAQAATVRIVGPARTAVGLATFFLFLDIGSGIGPLVLGVVVDRAGFPRMFLGVAVLIALSVGVYYLVHGRYPRTPAAA